MPLKKVFRENWLTRKPLRDGKGWAIALSLALIAGRLGEYPASRALVFESGEYWRAWTTLFVHADLAHLLSNLVLFVPFGYALASAYSLLFFPLTAFAMGGLVNLVVLKTLPAQTMLVGASGVVYWMGAAWITLAILVDRRDRLPIRLVKGLGVSMLLFLPEKYRPEVSYLAHLLGTFAGVASALAYYWIARHGFRRAEKYDYRYDFDAHWDPRINGYSERLPEDLALEVANPES